MNHEKGKYYKIILDLMGVNSITIEGGIPYLFKEQIKGIYKSVAHYFKEPHRVDIEEFKFSMRWALADVFGGGCEVEEPIDLFDDINNEDDKRCDFCLKEPRNNKLSDTVVNGSNFKICDECLIKQKSF